MFHLFAQLSMYAPPSAWAPQLRCVAALREYALSPQACLLAKFENCCFLGSWWSDPDGAGCVYVMLVLLTLLELLLVKCKVIVCICVIEEESRDVWICGSSAQLSWCTEAIDSQQTCVFSVFVCRRPSDRESKHPTIVLHSLQFQERSEQVLIHICFFKSVF